MKYDVAISVASEQNSLARDLSICLERSGYSPYFYGLLESDGLGRSLKQLLDEVYENDSRYCIIFVSAEYAVKEHTLYELRAALRRAARQSEAYLIPLRLDDTSLTELGDLKYIDLRGHRDMVKVCDLVCRQLGKPASKSIEGSVAIHPDGVGFIVLQQGKRMIPLVNVGCHIRNNGASPVTLHHLLARLTNPDGVTTPLTWKLFYWGDPVQMPTDDIELVVHLPAGESRTVGIQFAPPASIVEYSWQRDFYDFDLMGWVKYPLDVKRPDFSGAFSIDLSGESFDWVKDWEFAADARWKALNDPHNAVGIPATFSKRR
jgi:TIR domain-containing protein